MKYSSLLFILAFALSACIPIDPRNQAEADAMIMQAEQDQLDAMQVRDTKQKMDDVTIANAQWNQAVKDAGLASAKESSNRLVWFGGMMLCVIVCVAGISIAQGSRTVILGLADATARAAMVKANLVYIDPATGQFPMLLEYQRNGTYTLTDMNTGTTLLLDSRNEPDRLMIRGAAAIRHAGVVTRNARLSYKPDGVTAAEPLQLEAQEVQR